MKKEKFLNLFFVFIIAVLVVAGSVSAATTISTDISTGGVLTASGTATSSFIGALGVGTANPQAKLDLYTSLPTADILAFQNSNYRATFGFSPHSYEALILTTDAVNLNVLTLKNTNTGNAFSAVAFEGADGVEHGAIGVGNAGAGTFADSTYFETSYYPTSGTNVPWPMHFVQTGYLNGSNQTNIRMTIASTGDVQFKGFNGLIGAVYDPAVNRFGINTVAQPAQALDVLGSIVVGGAATNRGLGDGYAIHVNTPQTTTTNGNVAGAAIRIVRNDVGKTDIQWNGTGSSRRLDFVDTDNGSIIPLSLSMTGTGNVGIGTSAPTSQLQIATSSSNATTSVEIGKASQNKGSCLVMYDATGTVKYVSIIAGAFSISATSCK